MCVIKSVTPLHKLNESTENSPSEKYVFQGVFTQCSVPGHVVINRNKRIYAEDEVLKHLGYLRETIKNQGSLLGELDHPEKRFDIQLKEASHKITDLWYDQKTHCVMGKLEILDTPNGKIAKELVDAGYPLFVSSRAAGDVDERTHEVEIAQIFTYDIVCTPGFAEARLERMNEGLSNNALSFINESISVAKKNNNKNRVLTNTPNAEVYLIDENVKIDENVNKYMNKTANINELSQPLLEEDNAEVELPTADTNPHTVSDEDKKEDNAPKDTKKVDATKDDISETDEDKAEKRSLILDVTGEDAEGNEAKADNNTEENSDKAEKRSLILDIQAEETSEDDAFEEDNQDKEEDKTDDNSVEKPEEIDNKEDVASEDIDSMDNKKDRIKKEAEEEIAELDAIMNSVIKTESVKESIIRRYPFAISLSDKNFAKFAALRPNQKKKCADFIVEHAIYNVEAINELWTTPLKESKRMQQNWLRLASSTDVDLYCKAPIEVQNAIEESAKYVILETQQDVDEFWRKTGLRQAEAQRRMNEQFVSDYKKNVARQANVETNPLGYNLDYINLTEQWFKNNL